MDDVGERQWKPGDVAMAHWDAKEVRGFIDVDGRFYTPDQRAKGIAANHPAFQPTNLRPLVVIDPADREQVERLSALHDAAWNAVRAANPDRVGTPTWEIWQMVFRMSLDPTPPKPDEPMGLGAVVEDAEGKRYLRFASPGGGAEWRGTHHKSNVSFYWHEVPAVRVLSEGVTP